MSRDWLFAGDDFVCGLRAVGVMLNGGRILVQRDRSGNEYALPGGHIKIGETTEAALIREYKEEIGADIKCVRLLWTEECFWEWDGKNAHHIAFYYLVELCGNTDIPTGGEFAPHKDNPDVLIGWMPIENLRSITVYPEFIKDEICDIDSPPKHFTTGA